MEEKVKGRRLTVKLINLQENPTILPQNIKFNELYNFKPSFWKKIKSTIWKLKLSFCKRRQSENKSCKRNSIFWL